MQTTGDHSDARFDLCTMYRHIHQHFHSWILDIIDDLNFLWIRSCHAGLCCAMRQGQSLNSLSLSLLWCSYQYTWYIHHISYSSPVCSSPVCSLTESNSCSCADRAHNLKGNASHWGKDELGLTYAPCMDTYTNNNVTWLMTCWNATITFFC